MIRKGTVVTVLTDHTQGIVEEDVTGPNQEVEIRYGPEYSYLFGFDFDPATATRIARGADLQPETDFTPANRANRLFGSNYWHHIGTLGKPFDPSEERDCQYRPCAAKATRHILVNTWGTVCEYRACDDCAKRWHGKMVEDFPVKH